MKKQRLSNFELLRLLAMMFVLIVHADFIALGAPDVSDWASRPVGVVSQYLFECLAICCVDVFVLISGWFGIKFSFRKFSAFFFQVVFFSVGLFLAWRFIYFIAICSFSPSIRILSARQMKWGVLMILVFLLLVYVVAIGADRIRLFLWRKLEKKLYND